MKPTTEQLMIEIEPTVKAMARTIWRQRSHGHVPVEDIEQNCRLSALMSAQSFDPKMGSWKAYARRMMRPWVRMSTARDRQVRPSIRECTDGQTLVFIDTSSFDSEHGPNHPASKQNEESALTPGQLAWLACRIGDAKKTHAVLSTLHMSARAAGESIAVHQYTMSARRGAAIEEMRDSLDKMPMVVTSCPGWKTKCGNPLGDHLVCAECFGKIQDEASQ